MHARLLLIASVTLGLLAAVSVWGTEAENAGDAIERIGPGLVNWTVGVVTATGIGAPPPTATSKAQARALAERAAYSVAVRNLLEAVKGIQVDSTTVVEKFLTASDVIRTRVTGLVKGAHPIKTAHQPDGSVEVTVAISLSGELVDAILPKEFGRAVSVTGAPLPPTPPKSATALPPQQMAPEPLKDVPALPPPVSQAGTPPATEIPPAGQPEGYTGLIVDARGLGLKPALAPRLLDGKGHELYAGTVLSRDLAVQAGIVGYSKDLVAASRHPRVTDNPLIVKGLKASGNKPTDVVLAEEGVRTIAETEPTSRYLRQGRVVVVYD